jgi:inorganic pyrophosphatase
MSHFTFNAFIEISQDSPQVKYEYDHQNNILVVDRFLSTSMVYPTNYGFIPNTLGGDGDPIDVLVYSSFSVIPGALIKVRPIGALITEDEKGEDVKILTVPCKKIDPLLAHIEEYAHLPEIFLLKVVHFFENYKGLEAEKWVKVTGWVNSAESNKIITAGLISI